MDRRSLTNELKWEARRLGFTEAGVSPAVTPTGIGRFHEWLNAGYAGEMTYLADRARAYADPTAVLADARSVVMLAMNYRTAEPCVAGQGHGRISRYAWGRDYHDLIRERLDELADFLRRRVPGASARGVVDTAPFLEREFAQLAGLGWIGKNTLTLNKQLGSWFFLAALLTDAELQYDQPHESEHCGTGRACLDACPTGAFVDAYVLDATRCISYLTIELRSPIPRDLRSGVGDWLLGCDVCQDVCPWNHRAPLSAEPDFRPAADANPIQLAPLFYLSDEAFRARFRHTPLWRPKRRGLLRNAAIVLGNQRPPDALPALSHALEDEDSLVRGAAAWALGRYDQESARQALQGRHPREPDADVRVEIELALAPGAR